MGTRTRTTRLVWSASDDELLLKRFREGGVAAAIAAFPNRNRQATKAALRRVRFFRPTGGEPIACDREFVRAKIAAIPHDQLIERIASLLICRGDVGALS